MAQELFKLFLLSDDPELSFPEQQPVIPFPPNRVQAVNWLERVTNNDAILYDTRFSGKLNLDEVVEAHRTGLIKGDLFVYQHEGNPARFVRTGIELYDKGVTGFMHGGMDLPILRGQPLYFCHLRDIGFKNGDGITIRSFNNILLVDVERATSVEELRKLLIPDARQNMVIAKFSYEQENLAQVIKDFGDTDCLTSALLYPNNKGSSYFWLPHILPQLISRSRYDWNWIKTYEKKPDQTFRTGNPSDLTNIIEQLFPKFVQAGVPNNPEIKKSLADLMILLYTKWGGDQYVLVDESMELFPEVEAEERRLRTVYIGKIGKKNVPVKIIGNQGTIAILSHAYRAYHFFPDHEPQWRKDAGFPEFLYALPPNALSKLRVDGDTATINQWKLKDNIPFVNNTKICVGNEAVAKHLAESFLNYTDELYESAIDLFKALESKIHDWELSKKDVFDI